MKIMEIPRESVKSIQEGYRCSSCWNPVIIRFSKELEGDDVIVDCETEDCNTPGLVSAKYVDRRLSTNLSEANEAKNVLQGAASWLKPRKASARQNLSELGF